MASPARRPEVCPRGAPDINRYVQLNKRLPRLGEHIEPWEFRGWLLYYVQLGHGYPGVVDRWGYYARTMEAGRLLAEPIPQVSFQSPQESSDALKMLNKALELLTREGVGWGSALSALLDWMAWGLAVSAEPPRLSEKTNEALYREIDIGKLLLRPADYFGWLKSEGMGRHNATGFYPTPSTVVQFMVQMTMGDPAGPVGCLPDGADPRTVTVCDPCVGTGRFLLEAANYSFCLYGMDIDQQCVRATAVNGALYAPWLTFPFPAAVLGRQGLPEPPPAELAVVADPYAEHRHTPVPLAGKAAKRTRIDDRKQGLLF